MPNGRKKPIHAENNISRILKAMVSRCFPWCREKGEVLNLEQKTITSVEVADMVGKEHKELLRDIRRYAKQFAESKIALGDF